jgi:hypothetical protein
MRITACSLRVVFFLTASLLIFAGGGCGGGTSGTGVDDSEVLITSTKGTRLLFGTITLTTGSPVEGAIVRSVDSGGETETMNDGQFALDLPGTDESFVIEVIIGDRMAVVPFELPLESNGMIELQMTVDKEAGTAQVEISQSGEVSLFSEVPVETSVKEILL